MVRDDPGGEGSGGGIVPQGEGIINIPPQRPRRQMWAIVFGTLGLVIVATAGVTGAVVWYLVTKFAPNQIVTQYIEITSTPLPSFPTPLVVAEVVTGTPVPPPASTLSPTSTPTITPTSTETPIPTPTYLFEDTFFGGYSPQWKVLTGNPVVVNGQLTAYEPTWLMVGDDTWTDFNMDFDIQAKHCENNYSKPFDIGLRVRDLGNMAVFHYDDCLSMWYVVEDGRWTKVPNTEIQGRGSYYAKVQLQLMGPLLIFTTQGGVSDFTYTRSSSGGVALYIDESVLIDNIRVINTSP